MINGIPSELSLEGARIHTFACLMPTTVYASFDSIFLSKDPDNVGKTLLTVSRLGFRLT